MKNKDLFIISLLTLIVVLVWTVSQFIHTSKTSTITPVLEQQIKPITPNFDMSVLKQLKNR